jgi:hypothetical protein
MGMTHCRVCGVLDDVGEEVICEDCADKLSEHDAKIAEIAKIAKKERGERMTSSERGYRYRSVSYHWCSGCREYTPRFTYRFIRNGERMCIDYCKVCMFERVVE